MKRQLPKNQSSLGQTFSKWTLIFGLSVVGLACYSNQYRETAALPNPSSSTVKQPLLKNWGLSNFQADSHIHVVDAWSLSKGSREVVVAVIDTGVDFNHPDLKENVWRKERRSTADQKNNEHLSKIASLEKEMLELKSKIMKSKVKRAEDRIKRNQLQARLRNLEELHKIYRRQAGSEYGWDFVTGQANPPDKHGHGTHVAGIIGGALNRRFGAAGVAPHVSIMAVRYYDEGNTGSINLKNSIEALQYAIDNGARIINYSGGGPEFSKAEFEAIKKAEEKGVLIVAAAGNERSDIDLVKNYYYPSAYGMSNIISVAATDIENRLLKSSNWGKKKVDVAAPGENIYSTLPSDSGGRPRYGVMSGTSQATAFVSGLAALMLAENPSLSPQEIKSLIISTVDKFPTLSDKVASGGRINAHAALLAVKGKKLENEKEPIKIAPQTQPHVTQVEEPFRDSLLRLLSAIDG